MIHISGCGIITCYTSTLTSDISKDIIKVFKENGADIFVDSV